MLVALVHRVRLASIPKLIKAANVPTELREEAADTLSNKLTEVPYKLAKCTILAYEVLHHPVQREEGLIFS
jgi:hypothetical protein